MQAANDQQIRERAYQIWEDEGHPDGREHEHWQQAQRELDSQGSVDRDLASNPGIGASPGTEQATDDALDGMNTFEGDVLNDTTPTGGVDPNQRGRTNK